MSDDNPYRTEYERQRPRTVTALIRVAPGDTPQWFAKLLAMILLLLLVGLGLVGLILPILPGLLFLAFAVMLAAALFPAFGRTVRRTPWLARMLAPYLDSSHGFSHLSWRGKLRFVLWLTVKVIVDSFVLLWMLLAKLVMFLTRDKPRFD
jgi:uncharacterized membrane protein YbaN (DUF454 family)